MAARAGRWRESLVLAGAYVLSLLLTLGVVSLASRTWLEAAVTGHGSAREWESLRVEVAGWILTLASPVAAGLLSGVVFSLAVRRRAALHALVFAVVLSSFSLGNIAAARSQPMDVSVVLHALFVVAAAGCAAIGGKIAAALSEQDSPD